MLSVHSSGLHSAPDADVRAAQRATLEHLPHFASHTEARKHLDVFGEADGYVLHAGSECAVQVRRDVTCNARTVNLSPLPIPRRGGALCEALVLDVEASVGISAHTRIVIHMPSGVEGVTGLRRNEQARVYRDCIEGLQRLVAATRGPVVITGDWNVNLRALWVRRYLRRQFPGFTFTRVAGTGGTHGRRLIDFSLLRGFTSAGTIQPLTPASDHRAISERITRKEIPVTVPDPYAHSTFHGKPLDNATIAALKLAEKRLGYDLTIAQGIGGAAASAGTHTEGRAVDLAPFDAERKLRVLKDLGFAVWFRPKVEGLWGAHIHGILIFENRANTKGLAPVGFRQIAAYDAKRDGLKSNAADSSYRPSPAAVFTRAEYDATFAPPKSTAPTRVTRLKAAFLVVLNSDDARTISPNRKFVRGLLAGIRTLVNRIPER